MTEQAAPRSRRLAGLALRVLIGAAVFAFVVLRDPASLRRALGEADTGWMALALGAMFAGLIVSALRWRAYLQALEIPLPFPALFRLYLAGTFFNAFLPTGIGGDAWKAMQLARGADSRAQAFASVFLDRFAGVMGLALLGLGGVIAELARGSLDRGVAAAAIAMSAAILAAGSILLLGGERLLGRGRFVKHDGAGGSIRRAMRAVHQAGRHPDAAARGYLLGVGFQCFVLLAHAAVARALGLRGVGVPAMAGIVVISSMAALIPLTINGLGFREAAYVWALGTFDVGAAQARAFAVLFLAVLLATSIAGGIVYVARGGSVRARA